MIDDNVNYCITRMCEFPNIYKMGNQTPYEIMKECGYPKQFSQVTVENISHYLIHKPSLIINWLQYSDDIRYSPAWSFAQDKTGKWIVVYSGKEVLPERHIYDDKFEACAKMIIMTFESMRT